MQKYQVLSLEKQPSCKSLEEVLSAHSGTSDVDSSDLDDFLLSSVGLGEGLQSLSKVVLMSTLVYSRLATVAGKT